MPRDAWSQHPVPTELRHLFSSLPPGNTIVPLSPSASPRNDLRGPSFHRSHTSHLPPPHKQAPSLHCILYCLPTPLLSLTICAVTYAIARTVVCAVVLALKSAPSPLQSRLPSSAPSSALLRIPNGSSSDHCVARNPVCLLLPVPLPGMLSSLR